MPTFTCRIAVWKLDIMCRNKSVVLNKVRGQLYRASVQIVDYWAGRIKMLHCTLISGLSVSFVFYSIVLLWILISFSYISNRGCKDQGWVIIPSRSQSLFFVQACYLLSTGKINELLYHHVLKFTVIWRLIQHELF